MSRSDVACWARSRPFTDFRAALQAAFLLVDSAVGAVKLRHRGGEFPALYQGPVPIRPRASTAGLRFLTRPVPGAMRALCGRPPFGFRRQPAMRSLRRTAQRSPPWPVPLLVSRLWHGTGPPIESLRVCVSPPASFAHPSVRCLVWPYRDKEHRRTHRGAQTGDERLPVQPGVNPAEIFALDVRSRARLTLSFIGQLFLRLGRPPSVVPPHTSR